ncbi:hypothetical protein DVA86_02760 [Streptomyces armeniacus]|uniref:MmpS family membrane protein n=1 Tax=Streptomyces armeniacus TaxID=83291 RepID=A0A345XJB3_9ACTN|nr:MmpS family transport accessory protein [Streptomyces armeniacus]AXK31729.1 hypothetical protein DVA86_02760 [Streptomyces armeniacus]
MRAFPVVAVVAASAFLLAGCSDDSDGSGKKGKRAADAVQDGAEDAAQEPAGGGHTVVYEATSTGAFDVKYSGGEEMGAEKQVPGAKSPWKVTQKTGEGQVVASMTVTGTDVTADAVVSCKLTVDGKVVKEEKSKPGEAGFVMCVGNLT